MKETDNDYNRIQYIVNSTGIEYEKAKSLYVLSGKNSELVLEALRYDVDPESYIIGARFDWLDKKISSVSYRLRATMM